MVCAEYVRVLDDKETSAQLFSVTNQTTSRDRSLVPWIEIINTLRPRQERRHFRKGPIDNNPALVQIMAWRRSGDKPLSEPMMVSLLTHICVTRPQ